MAKPARLEPTVFLAAVSPMTVALVAGTVAATVLLGGPWWLAAILGLVVYGARVMLSRKIASKIRSLPRRIDPFALREPWRFYVRDALQARARFAEAIDATPEGPLRVRLVEIGDRLTTGVEECWEVAQKGQRLTDARRRIDAASARKTLEQHASGARHDAALARLESHDRIAAREEETRDRLDILDARLEESVARAGELATASAGQDDLDTIADAVDGIVGDLASLRLGLDDVSGG